MMANSGPFTSLYYWPHETTKPNQISVFQKQEPALLDQVFEMMIITDAEQTALKLVWEHQA